MRTAAAVDTFADMLDLPRAERTPERLAAVALARAIAELRTMVRGDDRDALLLAVLRLADPSLTQPILARIPREPVMSTWLADYVQAFGDVLPPVVFVVSMLRLLPADGHHESDAWAHATGAAEALGLDRGAMLALHGWLHGEASASVVEETDLTLIGCATASATARALVEVARAERARRLRERLLGLPSTFPELRRRIRTALASVLAKADVFGMNRQPLEQVLQKLDNDYFRVAVLGEFKRGKSTFINAVLGAPNLVAVDTIPCTSAVIEVRHAAETRYEVARLAHGPFEPSDRAAFLADTSRAHEQANDESAAAPPRWRVHTSAPFLSEGLIELVDTPGIGEDISRDKLAKDEALRADAAILIFDVNQVGSALELDLVERLAGKLENIIVVVNRADTVAAEDWGRIQDHLLARLNRQQTPMRRDRVTFLSAAKAEEALTQNLPAHEWVQRLDEVRQLVRRHLFTNSGPRKMRALVRTARNVASACSKDVISTLARREAQCRAMEDMDVAVRRAEADHAAAVDAVDRGARAMRDSAAAARALKAGFWNAWPSLGNALGGRKERWTTKHHPVSSPKKHAEGVADGAKRDLLELIQAWFRADGAELLEGEIGAQKARVGALLQPLRNFVQSAGGGSDAAEHDDVLEGAVSDAFGNVDVGGADAALRALAGAAIVLAVGYIVADIVLFYILGLIAGFLNPILLGAAAVGGVVLWLTKGEDYVRGWIRSKIHLEIVETFAKAETRQKLDAAFERAVGETFARIAIALEKRARALADEALYQRRRAFEDFEALRKAVGPIEALRVNLESLRANAESVHGALREVDAIAAAIEPHLEEMDVPALPTTARMTLQEV